MNKVFIIARKELLSTLRQRNMLLIMFLSPIVLVTIIGLAFSGLSSGANFADIPVAVVNLDAGFTLQTGDRSPAPLGLDWDALLQQNQQLALSLGTRSGGDFSINFGDQLAAILLSQPLTASAGVLSFAEFSCPLLSGAQVEANDAEGWSLDALLNAVALDDPVAARAAVSGGDYVAAVIIPPDFSRRLVPAAQAGTDKASIIEAGAIEVFANPGSAISASIVRAVVEGIAVQFERVSVAANALGWALEERTASLDPQTLQTSLQTVDVSALEPVGCLWTPQAGTVQINQQPVDQAQAQSTLAIIMVVIGGAQAVFFALFTGVFGINAIYEDRIQGTLQRLLVTPTPSGVILAGRLVGNLVIVMTQLLVLLLAFTAITSLVEWEWRFIWGTNLPALLLAVFGLSLFSTGLGVLIVGLAKSSEQVQLIGPAITILLSAASGSFGFTLPRAFAQFSPIWWGLDAMRKLAGGEADIGLHLVALFAAGIIFATVGTYFFRRRMGL